jgi:predicted RNase H-like HicB family nuclease
MVVVSSGPDEHPAGPARLRMPLTLEVEQEDDGRWLAEVPELPGVLAYGSSRDEAVSRAQALALRVLADRIDLGEPVPQVGGVFAVAP